MFLTETFISTLVRHICLGLKRQKVASEILFGDSVLNFRCKNNIRSADEVQSAYWNSSAVTLHPVVVYFKNENTELEHKNYIFVSDDHGHNIGSVYAILQKLMPGI
jgi:hypothetical protein